LSGFSYNLDQEWSYIMTTPLIQFENITKTFPGVKALNGVTFNVYAGKTHILMGENGAGKSTLMKILAGAYQPDSGNIKLEGRETKISDPIQAVDHGISMIYQELTVLDNLDVGRNIMLGQEPLLPLGMVDWKTLYRQAQTVLDELHLALDVHMPLSSLSIADRQMVEIARAARRNPRIIVMDEPTSSLGKHEEEVLFAMIERLKERRVAIIYISHRMDEVFRLGDTITVLRDGTHITTEPASNFTRERLIELMVGRKIEVLNVGEARVGDTVLETRGLSRGHRLKNIDIRLCKGEVLGVAGLVGAGQTDLAQVLFGVDHPDSGGIYIAGKPVTICSPQDAIQMGIAYVPEDRKGLGLVLMLPVQTNMALASLRLITKRGMIDRQAVRQMVDKWTQRLNIRAASPQQTIENLSGGNQQKVVLAKWLSINPRVLILNEPTRGIDVGAKTEVHHLIREIAGQGVAVMMVSSELPEVLAVSDRIIVMRNGMITGEMPARQANEKKVLELAFAEVV
jgi:rhamnose transport system ATP-binding protein